MNFQTIGLWHKHWTPYQIIIISKNSVVVLVKRKKQSSITNSLLDINLESKIHNLFEIKAKRTETNQEITTDI